MIDAGHGTGQDKGPGTRQVVPQLIALQRPGKEHATGVNENAYDPLIEDLVEGDDDCVENVGIHTTFKSGGTSNGRGNDTMDAQNAAGGGLSPSING